MLKKKLTKNSLTALAMVAAITFASASNAALVNGGFEADNAFLGNVPGASGWTTFEPVFTYHTADNNGNFGPVSHDAGGTNGLKMFGPWVTGEAGGAFQFDNSVVAGETYNLTAFAQNWQPDTLLNLGILQLSFYAGPDGTGGQLGGNIEVFASADGTQDYTLAPQDGADISDWTMMVASGVAPVGAQSAKAFLLNIQTGDPCCNGGSLFWDDVSLEAAPAVPVPAAVWLFGSGLLGLVGVARRRKA